MPFLSLQFDHRNDDGVPWLSFLPALKQAPPAPDVGLFKTANAHL